MHRRRRSERRRHERGAPVMTPSTKQVGPAALEDWGPGPEESDSPAPVPAGHAELRVDAAGQLRRHYLTTYRQSADISPVQIRRPMIFQRLLRPIPFEPANLRLAFPHSPQRHAECLDGHYGGCPERADRLDSPLYYITTFPGARSLACANWLAIMDSHAGTSLTRSELGMPAGRIEAGTTDNEDVHEPTWTGRHA